MLTNTVPSSVNYLYGNSAQQVLFSLLFSFFPVLIIFLTIELKIIPGGQLGFRCKDPALSYPFNGDTVSWKSLIAVSTLLPLAMVS